MTAPIVSGPTLPAAKFFSPTPRPVARPHLVQELGFDFLAGAGNKIAGAWFGCRQVGWPDFEVADAARLCALFPLLGQE